MFNVAQFSAEVRILDRSGLYLSFPSVRSAAYHAAGIGWLSRRPEAFLGDQFGTTCALPMLAGGSGVTWKPRPPHRVCRTAQDRIVSVNDLIETLPARPSYAAGSGHRFRVDPVPGVHTHGNRYCWHRRPQTLQALRDQAGYVCTLVEHGFSAPKVGRLRDIVTANDDITRHAERNWKRQRAVQYHR